MATPLPPFPSGESATVIEQRMVANGVAAYPDVSWAAGAPARIAVRLAAVEFAAAAAWLDQALKRGFPFDPDSTGVPAVYLDERGNERNVVRIEAQPATVPVRFTGTNGTVVPAGARVATGAIGDVPAQIYATTANVTVSGGVADTTALAETPGAAGNVSPGAVISLIGTIPGITAVTNLTAGTGGVDRETDAAYTERYTFAIKNPEGGGNPSDYVVWAQEASALVGGASVVINRDGPGTVSVAIIDTTKAPASQALVDLVQDSIAPPHKLVRQAETAPIVVGGTGTSIATGLSDDSGDSVLLAYSAGANGTLRLPLLHTAIPLPQPGIWQIRPRIKVSSIAGANNLLTLGVWNNALGTWAKTAPSAADGTAVLTVQGNDLALTFEDILALVNFYWDGGQSLEFRLDRNNTATPDTTTQVWVDQITFRSTMSIDQATGATGGKAPAGAKVTVEPATAVAVTITGAVTVAAGYDAVAVRAAAEANVLAYVNSLAFLVNNDVTISGVQSALLSTPGVVDYASVQINGAAANLVILAQQVAVTSLAAITIS